MNDWLSNKFKWLSFVATWAGVVGEWIWLKSAAKYGII